ncbi:hypothetical protein DID73_00630 [Candidatus Marinamargulisbacteria bacterium SCGC AG-343-K17]|nr:hypothetical protein DID73_00630 [Candidatus Marinamargulisbacteria bacterium SCGC AG-343-K17]
MIDAMVLAWFIFGVFGTVLRCVKFRQPISFRFQIFILLYCGIPFLIPFTFKAIGIVAIFIPFLIHRYFYNSPYLNLFSLFGLWLPFEMGLLSVSFKSSLPVDYAIILLTFFSTFISFSHSRSLTLFLASFRMSLSDLKVAIKIYVLLLLIIIPLGHFTGFLSFQFFEPSIMFFVQTIVVGYFLYALPEELLFRFLMFDFFRPFFASDRAQWFITSVIFGLAHINNRTADMVGYNWSYVLLSTIAGLGYGFVYMRTKKVSASALTHALINMIWGMFFNSPY